MNKFKDPLKKINIKDGKFILPLILILPVLFLGWMMFDIFSSSNQDEVASSHIDKEEVSDVPLADSLAILSKYEAIGETWKNKEDYTAVKVAEEITRISADTTLYTEAELQQLALLEQEQQMAKENIRKTNEEINQHNRQLADSRRYFTNEASTDLQEESLSKEIRMYQKILNGEELLTPEEEKQKEIERIRQEERNRVLEEINSKETMKVEKISKGNRSTAFNTVGSSKEENSYIRAMVNQGVTVTEGSRISFRLLDDIRIQGQTVPAGTIIYALVNGFGEQRVTATVSSIITKGKRVKVSLSVFDQDGIEGFFVPKSSFRDLTKEVGSQSMNGGSINIESPSNNLGGMAVQAIQSAYQSVTSAVSKKIRENKAKIKYNTTIYLINANE